MQEHFEVMHMSIAQMRLAIKEAPKYNYTRRAQLTWSDKVDRMSDKQVVAVYYRMLRGGELVNGR